MKLFQDILNYRKKLIETIDIEENPELIINEKVKELKKTFYPKINLEIEYFKGNINPINKKENFLVEFDRRKRVENPYKWPYSPKGVINFKMGDKTFSGSGDMIFPMIVLTAAHNLYDKDTKEKADLKSIKFIPGKNRDMAKFGVYSVLDYFFPEEFKYNDKEDYAILLLDKGKKKNCPGLYTGYYGLKIFENIDEILNETISVYGYPGDKNKNGHENWGMEIKVERDKVEIEKGIIKYDIDTFDGQSGSGVLLKKNDNYYIFAVHVRGKEKESYNEGTLITKKRLSKIKQWISKGLSKYYENFKEEIEKKMRSKSGMKIGIILNLQKKYIGVKGMKYLCEIDLSGLIKLNLSKNFLKDEGMNYFSKMKFGRLKSLKLNNNKISSIGMEYFSKMNLSSLEELNLWKNKLGPEGISYLSQMGLNKLKDLNLANNQIKEKGMIFLSEMKKKLENLEWFGLWKNDIKDTGMSYLAKIKLENLKYLNINNNNIGNKGIEYLSSMNLDKLKSLNLNDNQIEDEGIKDLAKMKFSLKELFLKGNKIEDKGIGYFSSSKMNFDCLKKLDLRNNSIQNKANQFFNRFGNGVVKL